MDKIKDTKLGDWLKEKAPGILDTVGDLLPNQGGLGIVKNLLTETLTYLQRKLRQSLMQRSLIKAMLQSDGRQIWRVM